MATVAVQRVSRSGITPVFNAASVGGDKFLPGEHTVLHVKNGSAVSITATIATPAQVKGMDIADAAVAVPAGEERVIGPFPFDLFQGADGLVAVSWSAVTTVTFAVLDA